MSTAKSEPDLVELHNLYDAQYAPFDQYFLIETVEEMPNMPRLCLRPAHERLRQMYLQHDPVNDFSKLCALAVLILEAGLSALRRTAMTLSHTQGEFDLYINCNDFENLEDGKRLGGCTLNIHDAKIWNWLLFDAEFLESPDSLELFYDDPTVFVGTEKSILVNPYLYPTWITDFLTDDGELPNSVVPALQQQQQRRRVEELARDIQTKL